MTTANPYISLADIASFDDPLPAEFDPSADANADKEIIQAGEYQVRVEFLAQSSPWESKVSNYGAMRKYHSAALKCTVTDGPHEDRRLYPHVATIRRRNGTSAVEELLAAFDIRIKGRRTQAEQMRLLNEVLFEPRLCTALIEWRVWGMEADSSNQRELHWFSRMERFPLDEHGNFIPDVELSDGTIVRAHNYVRAWKPIPTGADSDLDLPNETELT